MHNLTTISEVFMSDDVVKNIEDIIEEVQDSVEKVRKKGLSFTKIKCSRCGEICLRRRIGTTARGIIYTDENHKRWYGKKCPECVRTIQRELMRKNRNSQLHEAICAFCEKKFMKKRTVQYYCSRRCRSLIRSKK